MEKSRRTQRFVVAIVLLSCLSALLIDLWYADSNIIYFYDGNGAYHRRQLETENSDPDIEQIDALVDAEEQRNELIEAQNNEPMEHHSDRLVEGQTNYDTWASDEFTICGRPTLPITTTPTSPLHQKFSNCPAHSTTATPILVLEGYDTYGRTGNRLRSLYDAIQYCRDNQYQLAIMDKSWAMDLITGMWMVHGNNPAEWQLALERELCVRIISGAEDVEGLPVILKSSQELFEYKSDSSFEEYVASRQWLYRTLFRRYNTGEGVDYHGRRAKDMCSGIDSVFGEEGESSIVYRSSVIYTVIHLRQLEDRGVELMGLASRETGCDPMAALEMEPDYVKAILAPLDMLRHPIVIITDGQDLIPLQRLQSDPEIGPMIRVVSNDATWIGGDITLAVMSNVFIGNPASTFSHFIAQSRRALGFDNNHLYRNRDENGEWQTVCGDKCLYSRPLSNVHSRGWRGAQTSTFLGPRQAPPTNKASAQKFREAKKAVDAKKMLQNMGHKSEG